MPQPGPKPRWRDMHPLSVPLLVPALVILALGFVLPLAQRARSTWAQSATAKVAPAPIDGNRAYAYLKEICALGPRPAGSAANDRQRALVAAHFQKMGAAVTEQPFEGHDPKT